MAITGSSGFAGSHTAAALIPAGHDARVLVSSPDKLEGTLAPHGVATPEVVTGDVTDPGSVDEALDGADGLIHAANMFTFDVRKVHEMKRINEEGTKLVLGRAAKRNLDPIVHVSSSVALLPASGPPTEDSPIGNPDPTMRQPRRAGRTARRLQEEGAPVVIIYPGLAWGPHDPSLGQSSQFAMGVLSGSMRLLNDGPVPRGDVRDVATAPCSRHRCRQRTAKTHRCRQQSHVPSARQPSR